MFGYHFTGAHQYRNIAAIISTATAIAITPYISCWLDLRILCLITTYLSETFFSIFLYLSSSAISFRAS